MHSIQAEREPHSAVASIGIRGERDFGASGMDELCSVFCTTQDRQADGEPLLTTASNNSVNENSHPQPPGANRAQTKLSSPSALTGFENRHDLFVVSPSTPEVIALFR